MLVAHGLRLRPCPHALRSSRPPLCKARCVRGSQEGESDISTFARPAICPAAPSTANAGPLRYQRRFSGGALWRSLLPNRHSGAPALRMPRDSESLSLSVLSERVCMGPCAWYTFHSQTSHLVFYRSASTPDLDKHPATPHHA
jgi:hypothetical protein